MALLLLLLTGCSVVRIDTSNIDNILNIVLTKNNRLYNQTGQGYKYYLPGGVTYIGSDDLNDILYSNGTYHYLYIDVVNYKKMIKEYLESVLKYMYETKKDISFWQTQYFITVNTICNLYQ